MRGQFLGACPRTGLAGFLWDSFCNLGWWQVDYSDGSMRPQFDRQALLYADLVKAGLYVMPEAIVTFSNHSCCGLHGGNVYAGDLIGYSYNTNIDLWACEAAEGGGPAECGVLRGRLPFQVLFECIAHRRAPTLHFHTVPRAEWDAARVVQIKELLRVYREHRGVMVRRTVLDGGEGVLWEDGRGGRLLFCMKDHRREGRCVDAAAGEPVADGRLVANRAYRV